MKSLLFKGTSETGDLSAAIEVAIAAAKTKFQTDHIAWKLDKVAGVHGGKNKQNMIEVYIIAHQHKE